VIVGLSQRVLHFKDRAHDSIEHNWYNYLKDHALYLIPNRTEQNFDALADKLDILILTGGDDSPIRMVTEIKIATAMLRRKKPILGICHGAFVLTHLLGGKVLACENHYDITHNINYDGKIIPVNSFHSNCISEIPSTAKCLATDEDGLCEAWIDNNIGAIVWHPERMEHPFIPFEFLKYFGEQYD
jgi:gamma-glutamyl-gamma-aminobutyrate hydrolase PuuD